jgi:hypothetical protein
VSCISIDLCDRSLTTPLVHVTPEYARGYHRLSKNASFLVLSPEYYRSQRTPPDINSSFFRITVSLGAKVDMYSLSYPFLSIGLIEMHRMIRPVGSASASAASQLTWRPGSTKNALIFTGGRRRRHTSLPSPLTQSLTIPGDVRETDVREILVIEVIECIGGCDACRPRGSGCTKVLRGGFSQSRMGLWLRLIDWCQCSLAYSILIAKT